MATKAKQKPPANFSPDYIEEICLEVYKSLLVKGGRATDVETMLAKDNDGGKKMQGRANGYTRVVRATLEALAERGVIF